MQNKHRKNLHPFLRQDVDAKDILSSHAYGKVARESGYIPASKRPASRPHQHTVRAYKDSSVGSISQYREKLPQHPLVQKADDAHSSSEGPVVGNRPHSGTAEKGKIGNDSIERRHHFIEPPKRGFNRFG